MNANFTELRPHHASVACIRHTSHFSFALESFTDSRLYEWYELLMVNVKVESGLAFTFNASCSYIPCISFMHIKPVK